MPILQLCNNFDAFWTNLNDTIKTNRESLKIHATKRAVSASYCMKGKKPAGNGKERIGMTDAERKRLYRRIERNSRLRIPWYLRLASLLGIF